jgi:hypothetical protein
MLPAAERAVVDGAKVRDYLLSRAHPIGRSKARFFEALGYQRRDWQALQQDLRGLAGVGRARRGRPSGFGRKYEVHATLAGPNGRRADIVTVWIIRHGEHAPRLVTAFPKEGR